MQCLYPSLIQTPVNGSQILNSLQGLSVDPYVIPVRCRKCLPCKVAQKDDWTLRCLLDQAVAITSSFWTLTYKDEALPSTHQEAKLHLRNFFAALRAREKTFGNPNRISYFGCLEYGGKFGRPHFHLIIFNLIQHYHEITVYRKDLPRPRYTIPIWPHGHVDLGSVNGASINYVAGYLTDFSNPELPATRISTVKPAIGYTGLSCLANHLAKISDTWTLPPTTMQVRARHYSLSTWTKGVLQSQFLKAGGKIVYPKRSLASIREDKLFNLKIQEETPLHVKKRSYEKYKAFVQNIENNQRITETREQWASEIYRKLKSSEKPTENKVGAIKPFPIQTKETNHPVSGQLG